MAGTIIELGPILTVVTSIALGIYAVRFGWLVLRKGDAPILLIDRIALGITRIAQGTEAAERRAETLADPSRRRAEAISALVVGGLLLLLGALELAAVIWSFSRTSG